MPRFFYLILTAILILPSGLMAEWIPFNPSKQKETPPKVSVLKSNAEETIIKIELSGIAIKDFDREGNAYQYADLLSEVFVSEAGSPELPYIANILALPDQASVSVELIEKGADFVFKNIRLSPAHESNLEGAAVVPAVEDVLVYEYDGQFPSERVKIDEPSVFRDFRIARLSVYPASYNAVKEELTVSSSMTVRIKYGDGEVVNPKTSARRKIAPSFGAIYRSTILNYQEVLDNLYGGKEEGHDVLYIITPDVYYPHFQEYISWKQFSGIEVKVLKFGEFGGTSGNPISIKNQITEAYNNWENSPTYVMIVGDEGVFPTKIVVHDGYSFPWEEFFVTVEGNDYFPEMMIGRLPNQAESILKVMLNKFVMYERNPYVISQNWFKKGICCSNNAYESQVITKRFAAKVMREDGGFEHVDTMMSDGNYGGFGCSHGVVDIKAAINEGRSFVNYRGEGWTDGWHASCYYFNTDEIGNMANGQKMPFFTSVGCGVAMFQASGGNCFGEEWLKMGTATEPNGAICFYGPTSNTHTTYNNYIDRGIYVGMFREGLETPGQANVRGKLNMYNQFGATDPYVEYHYHVYCVLGDPSVHIWKEQPKAVTCIYPDTIFTGQQQIAFQISHTETNKPVKNANINITGQGLYLNALTDTNGVATINLEALSLDPFTITVRSGDIIPHQGQINVKIDDTGIDNPNIGNQGLLKQNQPNPFQASTEIHYVVKEPGYFSLEILDMKGAVVRKLYSGHHAAGNYSIQWDGSDDQGVSLSPGTYLYKIQSGQVTETRRMIKY